MNHLKAILFFITILFFASTIYGQTGGNYQITQSVIASGGGQNSTGGNFSIDGTIGQPIAGTTSTGLSYSLSSGFWQTVFDPNGILPPAIFKSFSPSSINVNETSTLTITLINPSSNTVALSGIAVTDIFPSGMQIDAVPSAATTCGGTFTAQANTTSVTLSAGVIAAGGFCSVSVKVKAVTSGEKINTTEAVTSTNGGTGGTATATLTVNQSAETYSVSGTTFYGITSAGQTPAPVSGVSLNATGSSVLSAISSASGAYQLSGLTAGGSYTITPSKSGEIKGINSLDATRIQQHRVGLITLTPNQLLAADTDNSGAVNSLDATRIQQRLVGIQSSNIIGQWNFVPSNRQYNPTNSNRTGENYEAILVGEVSGNWATAASFAGDSPTNEEILPKQSNQDSSIVKFDERLSQQIAEGMNQSADSKSNGSKTESAVVGAETVNVSLPTNASVSTGSSITIPVTVGAVSAGSLIESFDFTVFYDPTVLQPASPAGSNAGTLSANCSVLANSPQTGRVVLSGACASAITTASGGVLYNLQFNVIGTSGQQTGLLFNNPVTGTQTLQFNSENPSANTTNGLFSVLGPTAASVTVSGKVTNNQGRGIRNVLITMTDSNGKVQTARTTAYLF